MAAYRRLEDVVEEHLRMLNGVERTLEKQLPESDRRWPQSSVRECGENHGARPRGFPEPRTLNPE